MSPLEFSRKNIFIALAAITLTISGTIVATSDNLRSSIVSTIDSSTYQAVYLDNGDSYFGKITTMNRDFVTIVDVFYFLDDSKKTLVKREDNLLTINRDRVVATENLKEDGPILRAILKYKANKN